MQDFIQQQEQPQNLSQSMWNAPRASMYVSGSGPSDPLSITRECWRRKKPNPHIFMWTSRLLYNAKLDSLHWIGRIGKSHRLLCAIVKTEIILKRRAMKQEKRRNNQACTVHASCACELLRRSSVIQIVCNCPKRMDMQLHPHQHQITIDGDETQQRSGSNELCYAIVH